MITKIKDFFSNKISNIESMFILYDLGKMLRGYRDLTLNQYDKVLDDVLIKVEHFYNTSVYVKTNKISPSFYLFKDKIKHPFIVKLFEKIKEHGFLIAEKEQEDGLIQFNIYK